MKETDTKIAILMLRVALAFVWLFPAISSLVSPDDWIWFVPGFAREIMDGRLLLVIFSIFEIAMAIWLLSGKKLFFASVVSAVVLAGITFSNLSALQIVFRDISLALAALALAYLSKKQVVD